MTTYRDALPQLSDSLFLTDGGLETDLVFHHGFELPDFAAFVLLSDRDGRQALTDYYRQYAHLAAGAGVGVVLETPTWRANPDWAARLGYAPDELDAANRAAVDLLLEVRQECETPRSPVVVSGCIGPRGDGYAPAAHLSAEEAESYHSPQVATFAATRADLVSALTMTHTGEAIGIVRAAAAHGVPCVISFTVETDGRLPSGESLEAAVRTVDDATAHAPSYYMINCAHPSHFAHLLGRGESWERRLRGVRANASRSSHAELDQAEVLDEGDPYELAEQYVQLREGMPQVTVLGGCCGTDARHVDAIRERCLA